MIGKDMGRNGHVVPGLPAWTEEDMENFRVAGL
jgi:hypothetical protein